MRTKLSLIALALLALAFPAPAQNEVTPSAEPAAAEEEEDEKKPSLWDRLKKTGGDTMDKVGDAVGKVTEEVRGLSASVMTNVEAVEEMRAEMADLRAEVEQLRSRQDAMENKAGGSAEGAAPAPPKPADISAAVAPEMVRASDLASDYLDDPATAQKQYTGRYLKVVGPVREFVRTASGGEIVLLMGELGDPVQVKCTFVKDAEFAVELDQGRNRLINKADGTNFLVIGQPIIVSGTCMGKKIDIEMENCRIENLKAKPVPERERRSSFTGGRDNNNRR